MKAAIAVVSIFITAPIWYYLLYKILVAVSATDLMFFLYWVYVPIDFLVQVVAKLIEKA